MIASHIHDALAQVQVLQQKILERQRFRGYSGQARLSAGSLALLGAACMASSAMPPTPRAHLLGWGLVFVAAVCINYGSLLYWFVTAQGLDREIRTLRPTLDVFPPLIVGGLLTLVMVRHGHYAYLFGIWMSLFGLANCASRHVLPPHMSLVGGFYIASGALCLCTPAGDFLNPWPMGLVFGVGEWAGGLLMVYDQPTSARRPQRRTASPAEGTTYGDGV